MRPAASSHSQGMTACLGAWSKGARDVMHGIGHDAWDLEGRRAQGRLGWSITMLAAIDGFQSERFRARTEHRLSTRWRCGRVVDRTRCTISLYI